MRQEWFRADELRPGDGLKFLCAPWEERSDSWLSGILDGEGSLIEVGKTSLRLNISQKEGAVLERIQHELSAFSFGNHTTHNKVHNINMDRLPDVLTILGQHRPTRLLEKAALDGRHLPQKNSRAEVLSVEHIGRGLVVGIQTSTRTLITNGFLSHNTTIDEVTASDTDYIRSPTSPASAVYVARLSDVTDPTSSSGHIMRMRTSVDLANQESIDFTHQLRQGYVSEASQGTLIASQSRNGVTSTTWTDSTYTLSAAEADAITNYNDLFYRFVCNRP